MQKLTERELQVLQLLCEGKRIKDIANELNLSRKWIKNVRHYLGLKLDASTTTQVVLAAIKKGLVQV